MEIIPAIDIIDGKCVRLTQGDYAQKKIYNEHPLEVVIPPDVVSLRRTKTGLRVAMRMTGEYHRDFLGMPFEDALHRLVAGQSLPEQRVEALHRLGIRKADAAKCRVMRHHQDALRLCTRPREMAGESRDDRVSEAHVVGRPTDESAVIVPTARECLVLQVPLPVGNLRLQTLQRPGIVLRRLDPARAQFLRRASCPESEAVPQYRCC